MRLKPRDIEAIKWAAAATFGPDAIVYLYGSRLHDHLRGGDIDLLIDVGPEVDTSDDGWRFRERLFERIDEQKVDVCFRVRGRTPSPFVGMIGRDAVPLS